MAHIVDRFEGDYAILLEGDAALEVVKAALAEGYGRNRREKRTHRKENESFVGIKKNQNGMRMKKFSCRFSFCCFNNIQKMQSVIYLIQQSERVDLRRNGI